MENFSLRKEIDRLIASDAATAVTAHLAQLWREDCGLANASFIVSCYERMRQRLSFSSGRLFVLRSYTTEPMIASLRAGAFVGGIDLTVEVGGFNTYAQEMLDQTSHLYRFAPEVVILAVQTRDIAPDLWETYTDLSAGEIRAAIDRVVGSFESWLRAFRMHSKAHLIVHTLEEPLFPSQGLLDTQSEIGQVAAIRQINHELRRMAGNHKGVSVLDYDALVARYGRMRWYDERKWLTMRMPIAADAQIHLVKDWLRFIHVLYGKVCKALVTDLDNTLWGGVIGEDGSEGIQIGQEYPGAAYQSLQRVMLDLYQRGVLLAVCSKNDRSEAMEALANHPGMLVRPEHFAALRINWNDKGENLREIAAELNVGTDALAFLDDNPVERARVRAELPEVTVIELPDDPMSYAKALRESPVFDRLTLSEEDRERGRYYTEQRGRVELQQSVSSLRDFYHSLQQEVEISPATPQTLTRVAQLTQKTNQFTLTTRRYTEQQIAEMVADPVWRVYAARVKDRFGDNGLVGVAITQDADKVCEIDTFLMSCRVIGRTVETALLSFLSNQARARGMRKLQGWYLPTKKNVAAKEFYPAHKFQVVQQRDGNALWGIDLRSTEIYCPEWIRLTLSEGALGL